MDQLDFERGEEALRDSVEDHRSPDIVRPMCRQVFAAPTFHYKTGVVFLAYLNGHQNHFRMVGGAESARSVMHLAELFRRADQAGVLADPEAAVRRLRPVLALAGIDG